MSGLMQPELATSDLTLRQHGQESLDSVVRSPLFVTGVEKTFPSFNRDEVQFGKILGVGAFGVAREVTSIEFALQESNSTSYWDETSTTDNTVVSENYQQDQPMTESSPSPSQANQKRPDTLATSRHMSERCMRHGEARYAVKYLMLEDATESERIQARIDLAMEVKYLHVLSHPHIIKMRGLFNTQDPFHPKYFFIMDRLFDTLEEKINEWRRITRANSRGPLRGLVQCIRDSSQRDTLADLLVERLLVAHDIASALQYLHANKLVYRDLKPQNIGFDVRGHVKVFDFGLAKPLDPEHQVAGGLYNMTGMCGSVPYIAPEVALMRPYNEKCDVFSFGILLYGILSLRGPFPHVKTRNDFVTKVAERGGRPCIKKSWPLSSKQVLQGCWLAEPHNRPTMEMICKKINADVVGLTNGDMVRARAEQFMNISLHSLHNASKELTLERSSHPPTFVTTF